MVRHNGSGSMVGRALASSLLVALAWNTAAEALSTDRVFRVTTEQLAKAMQEAGFRAEIRPGKNRPYILSSMSGRRISVYMYDCNDVDCGAYQFAMFFSKTERFDLDFANQWNRQKRLAKAYIDTDGDLNFEWDVQLDGGVAPEFVKQTIMTFERYIAYFDSFKP